MIELHGESRVCSQVSGPLAWVEIDLSAIGHNVGRVVELAGPEVDVLAVVKDDAYGHGAFRVAQAALEHGATWLGVASPNEGISLRRSGVREPILVLGWTPWWQAEDVVGNDLVATVVSAEGAAALSQAAQRLGQTACVHIKVDTGMGRLGLLPHEVLPFLRRVSRLPALRVDGIFTHMASAAGADLSYTRRQLGRFEEVLAALRREGLLPPHIHAANSACILRLPESHHNLVRLGLAMYGLDPSPHAVCPPDFVPALAFKCRVTQVRGLPRGSYIGYGCTHRTRRASRIAVLPVGYAHGFRGAPAHWGHVLVNGERAPVVGRVCMDQSMIDVTDICRGGAGGVQPGDVAVLIGAQGKGCITADEVAAHLGTINYEVLTQISARLPRLFIQA